MSTSLCVRSSADLYRVYFNDGDVPENVLEDLVGDGLRMVAQAVFTQHENLTVDGFIWFTEHGFPCETAQFGGSFDEHDLFRIFYHDTFFTDVQVRAAYRHLYVEDLMSREAVTRCHLSSCEASCQGECGGALECIPSWRAVHTEGGVVFHRDTSQSLGRTEYWSVRRGREELRLTGERP